MSSQNGGVVWSAARRMPAHICSEVWVFSSDGSSPTRSIIVRWSSKISPLIETFPRSPACVANGSSTRYSAVGMRPLGSTARL